MFLERKTKIAISSFFNIERCKISPLENESIYHVKLSITKYSLWNKEYIKAQIRANEEERGKGSHCFPMKKSLLSNELFCVQLGEILRILHDITTVMQKKNSRSVLLSRLLLFRNNQVPNTKQNPRDGPKFCNIFIAVWRHKVTTNKNYWQ